MNTKNEKTNKAVIYCRVSTKEQVDEGNSLVSQERACKEYALKNGYVVDQVFIDQGESAKSTQRKELQKLLHYCSERKNGISVVVAYKIDRISRNTDDYSQIRLILKRYKVEIKSTSEYFEDSPAGRFMENIIANVAQFDNDVRTERCIGGMREAMREGRYVWSLPFGYSNLRIDGKLNLVPNESAPLISRLFLLVAQNNMTLDEIRSLLAKSGLVTRSGKRIAKSHFFKILRNETYKGWIIKLGERHRGVFKPLVSEELFDAVQLVLKYKSRKVKAYELENPDFPLRRFMYNSNGRKLTGGWSTGRYKKYSYYSYTNPSMVFKKDLLEQSFVKYCNQFQLSSDEIKMLRHYLKENFDKKSNDNNDDRIKFQKVLQELKESRVKLVKKNLNGVITDDIFKEHLELIEKEIIAVTNQLIEVAPSHPDYEETIKFAEEYLLGIGNVWEKLPFEYKVKLQWFNFPSGVLFDGQKIRTTKISSILKLKSLFLPPVYSSVHHRVNILNHQLGEKNKPNVVKTSGVSRGELKARLNKRNADKFDWKATCSDLKKAKKIIQGIDTPEPNIIDELKHNPLDEYTGEAV